MEIPEKNNQQCFHQGQICLSFPLSFKTFLWEELVMALKMFKEMNLTVEATQSKSKTAIPWHLCVVQG